MPSTEKNVGFFRRQELKSPKRRAVRDKTPTETAYKRGAATFDHLDVETPNMQPLNRGSDILLLGSCPGKYSDEQGTHFAGTTGATYRRELKRPNCDYICRTHIASGKLNKAHIAAFRKDVERNIARTKPKVVAAVGLEVLRWFAPISKLQPSRVRGDVIRAQVRGHAFYVVPLVDFALNARLRENGDDRAWAEDWQEFLDEDFDVVRDVATWESPEVFPHDEETLLEGVEIEKSDPIGAMEEAIETFGRLIMFDAETTGLQPHKAGERLLTLAISDGRQTLSIPVDHPESILTDSQVRELLDLIFEFFEGRIAVAHNLPFDLSWLAAYLGPEIFLQADWRCTLQAAYVLGHGSFSLEWGAHKYLGFSLKDKSPEELWNERLRMSELLRYGGLDAKYTRPIYKALVRDLKDAGLYQTWRDRCSKIPGLVAIQNRGFPTGQKFVRRRKRELSAEVEDCLQKLRDNSYIKAYMKKDRKFKPTSNDALGRLLKSLGVELEETKSGGTKVDKAALERAQKKYPFTGTVLKLRDSQKLLGTYFDKFDRTHPETYVCEDRRIHPTFSPNATTTGRAASYNPNGQNMPTGAKAAIRVSDSQRRFVSIDMGQIEARVFAMSSRDEAYCEYWRAGADIHIEWAEVLYELEPRVLEYHHLDVSDGVVKAVEGPWRKIVKNAWTFPQLFGASMNRLSKECKIDRHLIEEADERFWDKFRGLKAFQKKTLKFYAKHGYVVSLQNFRRYGPISRNAQLNHEIQSSAAFFNFHAGQELTELSVEEDKPYLTPILSIHDDLTFECDVREVPEVVDRASELMLHPGFEYVNVPLTVGIQVRKQLGEKVGEETRTSREESWKRNL